MTKLPDKRTVDSIRDRLSHRLNDHLCGMREGCDDSVTGFNEAWDVMRKLFDDFETVEYSGISWSGFNLFGDKASIAEATRILHAAGTVPALRERLRDEARRRDDSSIKLRNELIEALQDAIKEKDAEIERLDAEFERLRSAGAYAWASRAITRIFLGKPT